MRMSEEQWKRLVDSGATFERITESDKVVCKRIAEEGVKLLIARGIISPTPKGKP